MNEHFVTISIERNGRWFHLARYHDADYAEAGPQALARFLGLAVDDIFPISYDVRRFVKDEVDNIWVQRLDGSRGRQITNFDSEQILNFRWSPDGKSLCILRGHTDSDVVLLPESNR